MTFVDLTGMAISELLANAAIAAIVGSKVRSEFADGEGPPGILISALGISYSPGGNTRRMRLQEPTFVAKCYGVTRVQASQLGNAVAEAMELRRPRRGSGNRLVYLSLVDSGGDVTLDPVTKWPHADVIFRMIGAQQAVA